jgi:hypothetical protein
MYYSSFTFAGEPYALGDCVYLLPEEEGAPPYIAKLMRAWEDTAAADAEKLIIEVRLAGNQVACRNRSACRRRWRKAVVVGFCSVRRMHGCY